MTRAFAGILGDMHTTLLCATGDGILPSIQAVFLSFSLIRMPLKLAVVGQCRRLRPTCSFRLRSRPELRLSCVSVS